MHAAKLPTIIANQLSALRGLCAKHQVFNLYVFGSVLTSQFKSESDLDFLVQFGAVKPEEYADNFFDFKDALSQLFERKIDLVEIQTLKNAYFKQVVENHKMLIYERGSGSQMAA